MLTWLCTRIARIHVVPGIAVGPRDRGLILVRARVRVQDDDATLQKKAYRALETICTVHSDAAAFALIVPGGAAVVLQRLLDVSVVTAATAKRVRHARQPCPRPEHPAVVAGSDAAEDPSARATRWSKVTGTPPLPAAARRAAGGERMPGFGARRPARGAPGHQGSERKDPHGGVSAAALARPPHARTRYGPAPATAGGQGTHQAMGRGQC